MRASALVALWTAALGLLSPDAMAQSRSTEAILVNAAAIYYGMGELRWEHRLGDHGGLQTSAALGKGGTEPGLADHWLAKVGVQYRYYAVGDFEEGLAVAVEVAALGLLEDPNQRQGLALSPRLVYKCAFASGPTLELQVGGAVVARSAVDAAGQSIPVEWLPQASVAAALGWSF